MYKSCSFFYKLKKNEESRAVVDEIYRTYDKYLEQINHPTENKGAFYKQLLKNFEGEVNTIIAKINALS